MAETTTDQDGHYLFTDLGAGTYNVVITPPQNLEAFFDVDGVDTSHTISGIILGAGDNLVQRDFSYVEPPEAEELAETAEQTAEADDDLAEAGQKILPALVASLAVVSIAVLATRRRRS